MVLVRPAEFTHVEALREILQAFQQGFAELGMQVPLRENGGDLGAIPVVFGAQHLTDSGASKLPPNAIVYNAEQLAPGYPWAADRYLALLDRFEVWDFSARNVALLEARKRQRAVRHVPIPFATCLSRLAPVPQDVDVLFFGRLSERRKRVLGAAADRGLRVAAVANAYGTERDGWIARSKVALNMHYAEGGDFERARVVYLLANRKAVVCEASPLAGLDLQLAGGVQMADEHSLVDVCASLARDEHSRERLATEGYVRVREPSQGAAAILRRVLAQSAEHP